MKVKQLVEILLSISAEEGEDLEIDLYAYNEAVTINDIYTTTPRFCKNDTQNKRVVFELRR